MLLLLLLYGLQLLGRHALLLAWLTRLALLLLRSRLLTRTLLRVRLTGLLLLLRLLRLLLLLRQLLPLTLLGSLLLRLLRRTTWSLLVRVRCPRLRPHLRGLLSLAALLVWQARLPSLVAVLRIGLLHSHLVLHMLSLLGLLP